MSNDFPLAALVGQDQLKTALLLCAVSPGIGGALIRGDKGSAKSTAARGLAGVMAPIERALGCSYNCAPGEPAETCEICREAPPKFAATPVPFVNLPLGAGEDRVLGSLDFERALQQGRRAFQPGLLAGAHRGILYIDEVNLLPDHLVDILLDVAAMGVNRVQRDGLSVQHPARIALVGTMNQEEGELRPQLLDRFGMMVEVQAASEPRQRAEIVRRRLAWESDSDRFNGEWAAQQAALRQRVLRAQAILPRVMVPDGLLVLISELCCSQGVKSLRADLVMNKAVRALAALQGREVVEPGDLAQAALLVLPHRRRARPFDRPGVDLEELERFMRDALPEKPPSRDANRPGSGKEIGSQGDRGTSQENGAAAAGGADAGSGGDAGPAAAETVCDPSGSPGAPPRIQLQSESATGVFAGRRSTATQAARGRAVRAVPEERPTDLAVTATLQHSVVRNAGRLAVTRADLHQQVREARAGSLILFVVDASGSMAALRRMELVKGVVLSLLQDAYQKRDEVGVLAFRGAEAELILPPTRNVEVAEQQLRELPTGGRTPLAHALRSALTVISSASREPLLIVLSDGKANVPLAGESEPRDPWKQALDAASALARKAVATLVLDTEVGFVRVGRARQLAEALGAQCLPLEQFNAQTLSVTIRGRLGGAGA